MTDRRTFAVLLGAGLCQAQTGEDSTIRVRVTDATGEPAAGAFVTLLEHHQPRPGESQGAPTVAALAQSGKDGIAALEAKKGRRYTAEVRAYGFLPWSKENVKIGRNPVDAVLRVGFFVIY